MYSSRAIYLTFIFLCMTNLVKAQGIPKEVTFESDEGGYPMGYNPAKKLGTFDLSSSASNEPFRQMFAMYTGNFLPWRYVVDYRGFGFRASSGDYSNGKPKINRYLDINEGAFRDGFTLDNRSFGTNPVFLPDPNRTHGAQGQTFQCINAPFASVTIDNVDEASKFNFFILTEYEIDRRAKLVAYPEVGYLRWDIESVPYQDWTAALKGRQVWENGRYRHQNNGGTDPNFKNMDDAQFFEYVQNRWRYVFSELIFKTKLYSNSKVWMYGTGPLQPVDAFNKPQFDDKGAISSWWRAPLNSLWSPQNTYNLRKLSDEVSYMETWDNLSDMEPFAVLKYDNATNRWLAADILKLKTQPKITFSNGKPTRYLVTDIDGSGPNNSRKVRITFHGQDGSLRNTDQSYKIAFYNWRGFTETAIQAGNSSIELTTTTPTVDELQRDEDRFLVNIWNNLYAYRYIEPQKLGSLNWEPTPRLSAVSPYPLASNDVFNQRVYDAMLAFTNLQNFGLVYWDADLRGRLIAMTYESLALAQKKIAPYKTHIENQTLAFVGISLDNGTTWTEAGYPTIPFQQCYNGWWMAQRQNTGQSYPMVLATYNAQQKTILVAHLTNIKTSTLTYKIKVNVPTIGIYTFDLTSTKDLKYSIFKL